MGVNGPRRATDRERFEFEPFAFESEQFGFEPLGFGFDFLFCRLTGRNKARRTHKV